MSENKQTTLVPRAPHPDTLRDASLTILDRTGRRLLTWCPRHHCGATYSLTAMIWAIDSPISFGEWLEVCRCRDIYPTDDAVDLSRWIEACTQQPPGIATAPGGRC